MMFLWLLSKDKKNHIRYTTFYVCATYSHDKNIRSTKLYYYLEKYKLYCLSVKMFLFITGTQFTFS